jgi:predicted patatin/cPLA2 family phospholipase
VFRGERLLDGGLLESMPFRTALREGATHVLVLRSRSAGFRPPPRSRVSEQIGTRDDPGLIELIRARPALYNAEADELQRIAAADGAAARVLQIAVPEGARTIGRLETKPERIVDSLRLGAAAFAARVMREPVDILWQPAVYGAAEPQPEPAPLARPVRALPPARALFERARQARGY